MHQEREAVAAAQRAAQTFRRRIAFGARWCWGRRAFAWSWMRREIGVPLFCYGCIALGVESTTLLPFSTLLYLTTGSLTGVNMPQLAGLVLTPAIALVLAALVFDARGYERWRTSCRTPLLARMLRAFSDGVCWPRWVLPRRKH